MSLPAAVSQRENIPVALLLAVAGMAAFTPIFAAGKLAGGLVPIAALVWLRFAGGAATILCVAGVRKVPLHRQISPLWKLHLMRAVCGVGSLATAVYAASVMPLADATAIGLTKGIFAIALAGLILKELVTGRHWLAGILSLVGAYLVVQSANSGMVPTGIATTGVVAALASALFMATESLIMRYIAQREDTVTILAYVNVFAACLLAGPVVWLIAAEGVGVSDLLAFAWLGPLAIFGQSLNIAAYRRAGAATLAPAFYATVILSAIFGYAVWGEVPGQGAVLGAVLILAGGAVLTLRRPS
ncbi:DMT family transporter [Labrenzia sp. PHM005]|uniref:DMT family transporter n=1 Tax=Labrenzia sp. PHM005 TaxID=2590016 RepID=UPI0011406B2D|nr:DMT family transporter [Labrenzia sp. PHM005]QDG77560.1 DMT family transporter [Labrenzia sp. PHM005]